jgi:hypothetical protein
MPTDQPIRSYRHVHFLNLATKCRQRAERTFSSDLAESHLRLADSYESLAQTFARLVQSSDDRKAFEHMTPDEQIDAYLEIEKIWKDQQNNGVKDQQNNGVESNFPTHQSPE